MSNKLKAFLYTFGEIVLLPIVVIVAIFKVGAIAANFIVSHNVITPWVIVIGMFIALGVMLIVGLYQFFVFFKKEMRIHEMKLILKEEEE